MMEKARRSTKRVVVEMELVKEEYNERSETGTFGELKKSLALPKQGMSMYVVNAGIESSSILWPQPPKQQGHNVECSTSGIGLFTKRTLPKKNQ